jgi:hypothetical protein
MYAVDLVEGYRPVGLRNTSWPGERRRGAGLLEDNDEEFSGMGVTARPPTNKSLTPTAALKVTYRCAWLCVCVC